MSTPPPWIIARGELAGDEAAAKDFGQVVLDQPLELPFGIKLRGLNELDRLQVDGVEGHKMKRSGIQVQAT